MNYTYFGIDEVRLRASNGKMIVYSTQLLTWVKPPVYFSYRIFDMGYLYAYFKMGMRGHVKIKFNHVNNGFFTL